MFKELYVGPCKTSFFFRYKGGKGKVPKAPAPTAPTPTPQQLDENIRQKDQDRRRQRIAQTGRGGTILTSGKSLAAGNASVLGRSTS